jgi:hypothetical protein
MIRLSGLVTIPALSEEKGEKWIQQAIEKPGALRKSLKVKAGKNIPAGKLEKAAKKGGKLGKRARLAMTLKKLHEQDNLSEEQRSKIEKLMERTETQFPAESSINEDVNGAIDNMESDQGEDDHEGSMAKADLLALHKQAGELYNMIGEDEQLEGWIQSKITKAADYISSVYNNMQYEKSKPTSVGNGMGTPADADQGLNEEVIEEKAPEGWEATVKRMKQHNQIDNPWALAHWMKSKGYHPHAGKKDKK